MAHFMESLFGLITEITALIKNIQGNITS